eukprot:4060042-Amphidinium_carterae.1
MCSEFRRRQVTSTRSTPWYSAGPASSVLQREDAALILHCAAKSNWQQAEHQDWASMLTNAPSLALRSKKIAADNWWLSLGTKPLKRGAAVSLWPLREL